MCRNRGDTRKIVTEMMVFYLCETLLSLDILGSVAGAMAPFTEEAQTMLDILANEEEKHLCELLTLGDLLRWHVQLSQVVEGAEHARFMMVSLVTKTTIFS